MPMSPSPPLASAIIVAYAAAQLTVGVGCFLIYVLEQLGIIVI